MIGKEIPWPDLSQPDAFARHSLRVQKANAYFLQCIGQIQDKALAALLRETMRPLRSQNSAWLLPQNATAQKKDPALCARLAMPVDYDIWWGAPAAADNSHHCYPGGWLLHNATNLYALNMLLQTAQDMRGVSINSDVVLGGMILHDCLKPQLLLWQNGTLSADQGKSGHHVAALAEGYLRGVPPGVLHMLAGVHSGWWYKAEAVAGFLEQAAELIDRPELAYIPSHLDFLPETWIVRQGEAAWYDATRGAIQEVKAHLYCLLEKLYPPEERQAAAWWVLMHCDELTLLRNIAEGVFEASVRNVLLPTD